MSARYALALCESCDGCGMIEGDLHKRDCPDCLGTGYAEPQKRILNLQSEFSEIRYQRDEWSKECERSMLLLKDALNSCAKAMNDYETAVLREHRMQEQRDALAKTLMRLHDAADAFAADQSEARDERCGLVQPVSVAECEELNQALKAAWELLNQPT